jgi:hypothetical protein
MEKEMEKEMGMKEMEMEQVHVPTVTGRRQKQLSCNCDEQTSCSAAAAMQPATVLLERGHPQQDCVDIVWSAFGCQERGRLRHKPPEQAEQDARCSQREADEPPARRVRH